MKKNKSSFYLALGVFSILSVELWAGLKISGPIMMAQPYADVPCLSSLLGPPSLKGSCIPWQDNIDAAPTYEPARRLIFVGSAYSFLHVLDADSGKQLTAIPVVGRVVSSTVFSIDGQQIFVGTDKGMLSAFDAFSFKHLFDFRADSRINNDLLIHDSSLYFSSAQSTVYSINLVTGALNWKLERPLARDRLKLSSNSNILYSSDSSQNKTAGQIIAPHPDGFISVIAADTGKILRKLQLALNTSNFPDIVAPMIVLGNNIWVASHDSGISIVDLRSGQIKKNIAQLNVLQMAKSPTLILTCTLDSLVAFSPEGNILWKNEFSLFRSKKAKSPYPFNNLTTQGRRIFYGMPSQLLVSEKEVIMATTQGALGFFDLENGRLNKLEGISLGFSPKISFIGDGVLTTTRKGSVLRY